MAFRVASLGSSTRVLDSQGLGSGGGAWLLLGDEMLTGRLAAEMHELTPLHLIYDRIGAANRLAADGATGHVHC
jgi:hypothetical protein